MTLVNKLKEVFIIEIVIEKNLWVFQNLFPSVQKLIFKMMIKTIKFEAIVSNSHQVGISYDNKGIKSMWGDEKRKSFRILMEDIHNRKGDHNELGICSREQICSRYNFCSDLVL